MSYYCESINIAELPLSQSAEDRSGALMNNRIGSGLETLLNVC